MFQRIVDFQQKSMTSTFKVLTDMIYLIVSKVIFCIVKQVYSLLAVERIGNSMKSDLKMKLEKSMKMFKSCTD